MTSFDYTEHTLPVREDIPAAYRQFWSALAAPGTWWTGHQRVAIADESRHAGACLLCAERKTALSPYGGTERHADTSDLTARAVDAIHRIITDQNRITRAWVQDNAANGLSQEAYVELVGIVVTVFSIDEFHRALDMPLEPLPHPLDGEPSRYRPSILSHDIGFVPTVPPEGALGEERDLWPLGKTANVVRALSLVPNALRDWRSVAAVQYLALTDMGHYGAFRGRSLHRMQMELIAGRVSAVNECFY